MDQKEQQASGKGSVDDEEEEEDRKLPAVPDPGTMVYREDEQGEESSFSQQRMLDEERIHPSAVDASIRAADVLCGRGKMSFNHGA